MQGSKETFLLRNTSELLKNLALLLLPKLQTSQLVQLKISLVNLELVKVNFCIWTWCAQVFVVWDGSLLYYMAPYSQILLNWMMLTCHLSSTRRIYPISFMNTIPPALMTYIGLWLLSLVNSYVPQVAQSCITTREVQYYIHNGVSLELCFRGAQ